MCRASLEVEVDDDVVEVLPAVQALQVLHGHRDASLQGRWGEPDQPDKQTSALLSSILSLLYSTALLDAVERSVHLRPVPTSGR